MVQFEVGQKFTLTKRKVINSFYLEGKQGYLPVNVKADSFLQIKNTFLC